MSAPRPIGLAAGTQPADIVRLNGIHKVYDNGTRALAEVDLTIGEAQFVSLLGPSGCGKSTALRLIAGLGKPSAGTIDWPLATHDADGEPKREIGFVFQEPTLMPWRSVFDNVYLPLKVARVTRRAARELVAAALAMVGLESFADAYPRELSGGMKMRVSIARAIVDEPFAALDEITRFELNNDLLSLWHSGSWTVVFVTHSVYESVYLSNRIVLMGRRPGRVIADLTIDAPYPRDEEFRTSTAYNQHCREVSRWLRRAMES
jgi:NitT/TauT family transport system ATP-binding protein